MLHGSKHASTDVMITTRKQGLLAELALSPVIKRRAQCLLLSYICQRRNLLSHSEPGGCSYVGMFTQYSADMLYVPLHGLV